jgi:puromycin-sensitive aminopeptidase
LFALDCATKSLDAYNDFFGIKYPLPKLDMVAIPEFAAGAMENWGLVTYREVDLLIDPAKASSNQKQRVCTVVTHELAHQWFGNLVTMTWWDDLWLNEGFASWAENWAADVIYPEWSMWDQFTTGHLSSAMRLDALRSSHPIQVPIHHAEEVEEVFDAISYCKGGSVVKMIRAVLGMKAFQAGLGAYMKKHAYGNTETFDLWTAWEESSGLPVQEMMASWTEQMGFPIVAVTDEKWEDDKITLTLEQSWFLSDGSELTGEEKEKKWCIPIITCTSDGTQQDMTFMREKTATITVPLSSKDGWVKLNAGQDVPMRVNLTSEMIERLGAGIKSKCLPAPDRAALLTDGYALVKAGKMEPEALIKLLSNYSDEDTYIVWCGIADILGGLETVLGDDASMSANFKEFAKRIVIGLNNKVGWEAKDADGHLTVLLRGIMIGLLSNFCHDDADVATEASKRFAAFLADPNDVVSLPSDMRTAVFKIVLKNGGVTEYEQVKNYFATATDNAERKFVLGSLGHSADPKLKQRTLAWSISGEIKLQDFFYPMGSVRSSSTEGRSISWSFLQANFEKIQAMIGKANPSLMDAVVVSCAGGFCSDEKADEIEAFFKANPLPKSARKIQQTVENMRSNAKFFKLLQASELSKPEFWATV